MPNIIISPSYSNPTGIPRMDFIGASGSGISLQVLGNGGVSFVGTSGALFSISDSLIGSLMAVTDIGGVPILEVFDSDKVVMGRYGSNTFVVSGSGASFGTDFIYRDRVLYVSGNTRFDGHLFSGTANLADIYYPRSNPSGYITGIGSLASVSQLNSLSGYINSQDYITGSSLFNLVNGLSGQANIKFATVANLQSTGQTLYNLTTALSGQLNTNFATVGNITYLSGVIYATGSLLSAVRVTGSNIINSVNLSGIGGAKVFTSGGYVFISGGGSSGGGGATLDTTSAITVPVTSNAVVNGTALRTAYAAAKILTPNGAALSATNRAVLFVPPGKYDLVTTPLTLDTQFVDLVGVSGNPEHVLITSIVSALNSGTLVQTANDVLISGVTLENEHTNWENANLTEADPSAYMPNSGLAATKLRDVVMRSSGEGRSMRLHVNYAGTYTNCVSGMLSFGYGYGGTASGTFTNCTGGDYSFASDGTASGTFTNCVGGNYSFGSSGAASGTFNNCNGGTNCFGGNGGTAGGTFVNCISSDYSFGSTATGIFTRCIGGDYSFGSTESSGTFTDCIGGTQCFTAGDSICSGLYVNCRATSVSFGGYSGIATGTFIDCRSGDYSFGGDTYGTASGVFTNCISGQRSFGSGTASGVFTNCVGGLYSFGMTTASGTFKYCTGASNTFGGVASGNFIHCTAGDNSFGVGGAASGVFTNCTAGDISFGIGGAASGTFTNCKAGFLSFGGEYGTISGTFINCTGGAECFGSFGSSISGVLTNCTGGAYSFGAAGSTGSTIAGSTCRLYFCRITSGTFTARTSGAKIKRSFEGDTEVNDA